jgi:hypothetical protein
MQLSDVIPAAWLLLALNWQWAASLVHTKYFCMRRRAELERSHSYQSWLSFTAAVIPDPFIYRSSSCRCFKCFLPAVGSSPTHQDSFLHACRG